MSAPVLYLSTDASAPTLTGQVGSLVALLDAILVNGYGAKSAAGWTKAFSGTNTASYRQAAASQFYLDVLDNANGSGGAKEATVRGYEVETAINTGTNAFPNTGQVSALVPNWRKSNTADSTARAWGAAADDRTLILWIFDGDSAGAAKLYVFGDFFSHKVGDSYRCGITVRTSANSTTTSGTVASSFFPFALGLTGIFFARVGAGTGTSVNGGNLSYGSGTNDNGSSPSDGNIYLERTVLTDATSPYLRGYYRGMFKVTFGTGLCALGDTFGGTGFLSGRSFYVVKGVTASTQVAYAIETSNTWDTSS